MYNQNYQVNYTASYICFMKGDKYFHSSSVDYSTINSLKLENFLLNDFTLKYHCKSIQYILPNIWKQYFSKQL